MRLTFEGETLDKIFQQMADVLGVRREGQPNGVGGRRGGESYSDWAGRANEAATEAGKALDEKAPPPTPAVKALLDEAKIPETEYDEIGRSGKGNKITKTDAKAYIKAREMKKADDEVDANVKAPREFPAPAPTPETTPDKGQSTVDQEGEAPEPASEPEPVYDFNDVKSKLTQLNTERGMKNTIASLARFGVDRISALNEAQYAEFIAYADQVIAKKADPLAAEQ